MRLLGFRDQGLGLRFTLVAKAGGQATVGTNAFCQTLGAWGCGHPVGSGGRGVVRVPAANPRRLSRAFVDLQRQFPGPVVVQAYSERADQGEKRLFWVDGQIVGAYLRTRAPGAFHHNLQRQLLHYQPI